ncbi:hypothetical protein ACIGXM_14700 [Kitasatospora sp. NPDC052896]|uniref:hypothetical protein n=1 Tax=Kitasatospora sp. NPDC052896 TaxID=3364061 RepID=UPI0037C6FE65
MSRFLIPACALCRYFGDPAYPAAVHRTIARDGGPFMSTDLCKPHDTLLMGLLGGALYDEGEYAEPAASAPQVSHEESGAPIPIGDVLRTIQQAPQEPLPLDGLALPAEEAPVEPEPLSVLCKDCEPAARVEYSRRVDHARHVHKTSVSRVIWTTVDADPLPFPCEEHDQCEQTGFGYYSERGLLNHIKGIAPPSRALHKKSAAAPKAAAAKPKVKPAKRGARKDEPQVVCPEEHGAGSEVPFHVSLRNRQSHARSRHGVDAPYIAWENPHGVELPVLCFEHKSCADAGGFGFPSALSRQTHSTKSRGWAKAESKDEEPVAPAQAA